MQNSCQIKMAVLGAGAWGTALAISFARSGHDVTLWTRDSAHASLMLSERKNTRYLAEANFPESLAVTSDIEVAVASAELVLVVTPIAGLRPTLERIQPVRQSATPVFWACKGFEVSSRLLPHQVVKEVLGDIPCGTISGPSFAREVALGQPTAVTLACASLPLATEWVQKLNSARLRLYATDDMVGVEVGGAVKNILAIAAGVADGLSLGHNARAALITRGLAELTRLAICLGGRQETMMGLAGLGDLVLTCTGDLSRNRRVGMSLAEDKPLKAILADLGHVAEGVPTALETEQLAASLGVSMPITNAVCRLLRGDAKTGDVVADLLARVPVVES
ncbi:NAD(P)-dependent glycerol-3-phosphate dehydrogenase [Leeia sp. TBRC 13508]|uniref:Glycerol-3-phosphate dehydrogenase [NAD(P)+] n=1 Tax=Leeia speluncae TaxID=2884804 RepID=A0ABS8D5Q5_9NEIS|nr:NAD(P)H-dependent glycerol-3-phosphate dehydrogenase [Leeia speluncae]MCB6183533.1 NAD(P)-dependent glycerol-3-phosphate dehydrogenase [Leeia speluncae]